MIAVSVARNGGDAASMTDTALVFEDAVGLDSRAVLSHAAKSSFSQVYNALSGEETERFPSCEQTVLYRGTLKADLPVLEAMRADKQTQGAVLTLDALAAVLALTGGIREISEKSLRRWPATAGNLGSVELFLVNRNIEGLHPGFFFYEPRKHVLASLKKRESVELCEFMCRVLGRANDDLPDAIIVMSGAFGLLSKKYGSFAYRLIHLDAGSALSQLCMVAQSMGLCARTASSLADDLMQEQFNLTPSEEQPTAVVEMWHSWRKEKWRHKPSLQNEDASFSPRSWKAASKLAGLDLEQITTMLLDESRVLEHGPWGRGKIPPQLLAKNQIGGITTKLPKPDAGRLSVGQILARRRSIRNYSRRPVELNAIATALHYAFLGDTTAWPDEYGLGFPLQYFVLARHVLGIEPAVYLYDADRHSLARTRPALSREETVDLLVQSEFADAPVLLWITGNLAAACAEDGAKGHRHLLLRAGAAGHRMWMAALSLGLSGAILAGLIPGAARRSLGIDGYTTASLFACALGYESEGSRVVPA